MYLCHSVLKHGGTHYTRVRGTADKYVPLVESVRVLLKSENSVLSMSFRYACDLGSDCRACSLTPPQKKALRAKGIMPTCIFDKRIVFQDTCLQFPSSLHALIKDAHDVQQKLQIPLHLHFPTTFHYCQQAGFNYSEFKVIVDSKL